MIRTAMAAGLVLMLLSAWKPARRALDLVPALVEVRASLAQQLVRQGRPQETLELLRSFDRSLIKQSRPPTSPARSWPSRTI